MLYLVALGPWEIGLIIAIVLIVFGAGRLPQAGGALGRTIREFRTSMRDKTAGADDKQGPEQPASAAEPDASSGRKNPRAAKTKKRGLPKA